MKAQILKISGCKTQKEFYTKYPTEEAFMKVHKKEFKKALLGETIKKAQGGYNISNDWRNTNPTNPGTANSFDLSTQWSETLPQAQNGTSTGIDMSGSMPYIQAGTELIQGLSALKGEKDKVNQAKQSALVSGVQLDAARTRDIDANRMNKQLQVRPEDMIIQPNQLNNPYGVGTNVLQGRNGLQIGGEIQNTYAPNTIYNDGGYEPLNDSDIVKQYQDGGFMDSLNKSQFGKDTTSVQGQNLLNNFTNRIVNDGQGPNAGSEIGGGTGSAIGTAFGGPLGGMAGKFIGEIGGGLIDSSGRKIKRYNQQTDQNIFMANQAQMDRSNAYMKEGGWMNPDYNPQLITKFGNIDVTDLHNITHDGMDTLRTGGNLRQNDRYPQDQFAVKDGMSTQWGGGLQPISQNPYLDDSGIIYNPYGQSHTERDNKGRTGIGLSVGTTAASGTELPTGKSDVEVEKNEPIAPIGNAKVVYGNLTPSEKYLDLVDLGEYKGQKFKRIADDISNKTNKLNILGDKSIQQVNNHSTNTSIDKLGLNGLQANLMGIDMQHRMNADKLKRLGDLQQSINELADENGWVADNLAKGEIKKAKNGKTIAKGGKSINDQLKDYTQYNPNDFIPDEVQPNTPDINKPYSSYEINQMFGQDTPAKLYGVPDPKDIPNESNKFPWMTALNSVIPYARPNYQLDRPDLSPEMMAMGMNNQEPVQARTFQPQLSTPYDVSYQDMLNRNQGDFKSMERMAQYNPAMLSQLGAQKYSANQQVLGEQFRQNQAEKDKVYGENRNAINQSQLANLGILNQQAEKQDMAKTKTKAEAVNIAQSIADKMAKYKEEQMISRVGEHKSDFRIDPSTGMPINMNQLAQWNMAGNTNPSRGSVTGIPDDWMTMIDAKTGEFAGTRKKTAEELKGGMKNGGKIIARNGAIVKALKTIK